MVHNVRSIEAILADGTEAAFGAAPGNLAELEAPGRYIDLVQKMRALGLREAAEIDARIPKLLRKVGGYNIDSIDPAGHNMASLLVGSEGTLAFFHEIELDLQPIPEHKVLGICHFPTTVSCAASRTRCCWSNSPVMIWKPRNAISPGWSN
jgi:FAD/FMN-containing dehydrogenase